MKNISILGCTGSIGTQTLDVIKRFPDKFKVIGLSALNEVEKMIELIKEFNPMTVSLAEDNAAKELKERISGKVEVFSGEKGNEKIACLEQTDTVVTSVVGSVGINATLKAIKEKKNIALANKETLVAAGEIVMNEVKKNNVKLMPIDSEHSALFQCLNGENIQEVEKLIITCSGGSFRFKKRKDLENVTVKEALSHPNWAMGGKITIDSATLMNKGLEVIEAHWLYGMPYEKIETIMHPQSIIHSMVEFKDGQIIAQLGCHDMRLPILYALSYPKRIENNITKMDFKKNNKLEFFEIDHDTFPCLSYAIEAGKKSGTMPAAMNAANEIAVFSFLKGEIKFLEIEKTVREIMNTHSVIQNPELEEILKADAWARKKATEFIRELK